MGPARVALWFLFDFNAGSGMAWWDDVALSGKPKFGHANVDMAPDTINLRSQGRWIAAYIELIEGYNVADINTPTVKLNWAVQAELKPVAIGDYDNDGYSDLMIKFDREAAMDLILKNSQFSGRFGTAMLTSTGELKDGRLFGGNDTIRVVCIGPRM